MFEPTGLSDPGFKFERLQALLGPMLRDGLIVAFSGGVDSAFLLWAAETTRRDIGGTCVAITAVSDAVPERDLEDAVRFADLLGVHHIVEQSDETSLPAYVRNDVERCYHCKSTLFRAARAIADQLGTGWLAYGYTASDRSDSRPGHRAAGEWEVISPLADAQLSKDDIRSLMRLHGVPLSEKPASPCLSSRIMTGISITQKRLKDVGDIEVVMQNAGIRVSRVRVCGGRDDPFLRIEVDPDEMPLVLSLRDKLVDEAKVRGYRWAVLDLAGYRTGGGNT